MKTITYVESDHGPPSAPRWDEDNRRRDYRVGRTNGNDIDSPSRPLVQDGTCVWTRPGGGYHLRYTEGAEEKKWMEERDRNYVFRLEREGALDAKEPNLRTEVPKLYEEVMIARRKAAEELAKKQEEERKFETERILLSATQTIMQPVLGLVDQIEVLIRNLDKRMQSVEAVIQHKIDNLEERVKKLEICSKDKVNVNSEDFDLSQKQNVRQSSVGMFSAHSGVDSKEREKRHTEVIDTSEVQFV